MPEFVFVKHDFLRFADAAQFEHVMDHEHESLERRFAGVDQAEAKEVEVRRAGNMPFGVIFRRSHVNDAKICSAEFSLQFACCCEQGFARILFIHRLPITLVEMALQINKTRYRKFAGPAMVAAVLVGIYLARRSASLTSLPCPGENCLFPPITTPIPTSKPNGGTTPVICETESGKQYGYQVTFFRFGVRDRQKETKESPLFTELYMAHFALSDIAAKKFTFRERINRGYNDKAGAATDRYLVWNEDWKVEGDEKDHHDSSQ